MHAYRDVEKVFQFWVSQNMIGMTMGVQDIFDMKAFCFDQGQQFVFISGRINDNCIQALGAGHQIGQDLKRFHGDLLYYYFNQDRLFYK
jgi:hypothetical protein